MPRKKDKKKPPLKTMLPKQKAEPTIQMSAGDFVCEVCGTSYGSMTSTEPQACPNCGGKKEELKPQKTWPTPPTFPAEINYYKAEEIENFRKKYKAFLKKYGELAK